MIVPTLTGEIGGEGEPSLEMLGGSQADTSMESCHGNRTGKAVAGLKGRKIAGWVGVEQDNRMIGLVEGFEQTAIFQVS